MISGIRICERTSRSDVIKRPQSLKRNHILRRPVKAGNAGKSALPETVWKEMTNHLNVIMSQTLCLANRDEAIHKLRNENIRLRNRIKKLEREVAAYKAAKIKAKEARRESRSKAKGGSSSLVLPRPAASRKQPSRNGLTSSSNVLRPIVRIAELSTANPTRSIPIKDDDSSDMPNSLHLHSTLLNKKQLEKLENDDEEILDDFDVIVYGNGSFESIKEPVPSSNLPQSPRTRKVHRNYTIVAEEDDDDIQILEDEDDVDYVEDEDDVDYVEEDDDEEEEEEEEESEEEDEEREPKLVHKLPSTRKIGTSVEKLVSGNQKPDKQIAMLKQPLTAPSFRSPYSENSLSRPTLSERLPKSNTGNGKSASTSKASKFQEFVNQKRARLDSSKKPMTRTSSVLNNKRTGVNGRIIRDRLGSMSNRARDGTSRPTKETINPFPTRTFATEHCKGTSINKSGHPDVTFDFKANTMSTCQPYHVGSAQAPATGEEHELAVPNGEVEVPNWRVQPLQPSTKGKGTEDLDDLSYLKRHGKGEENEKRRKRWDAQKLREDSYVERLKSREAQRSQKAKPKPKRLRGSSEECVVIEDIFLPPIPVDESFHPDPKGARFIEVNEEVPVTAFGYPLPPIRQKDFDLAWEDPNGSETVVVPDLDPDTRNTRRTRQESLSSSSSGTPTVRPRPPT